VSKSTTLAAGQITKSRPPNRRATSTVRQPCRRVASLARSAKRNCTNTQSARRHGSIDGAHLGRGARTAGREEQAMTVIHAIRSPDSEPDLAEFQARLELATRVG
jgi:hypothetical protein